MPLMTAFTPRPTPSPTPVAEPVASSLLVPVVRLRPRRAWLPRVVDPDRGCGWFESSRVLREGLVVIEHADEAALPWLPSGSH